MAKSFEGSIGSRVEASISTRPRPFPEFGGEKSSLFPEQLGGKILPPPNIVARKEFKKAIASRESKRTGKENKNLSIGNIKWLVNHKWGHFARREIDERNLPDTVYNAIVGIIVQESGGKPQIKNDHSSATGLMQMIDSTAAYTARALAEECDCGIDPKLINRKNPNENIALGIFLFKKNWKISHESLKWTILFHYAGSGAAKDTADAYGGIEHVPFVQNVLNIMNTPEEEPPAWAMARYRDY